MSIGSSTPTPFTQGVNSTGSVQLKQDADGGSKPGEIAQSQASTPKLATSGSVGTLIHTVA